MNLFIYWVILLELGFCRFGSDATSLSLNQGSFRQIDSECGREMDTLGIDTGQIIRSRFKAPLGYFRKHCEEGSFDGYLSGLPLKPPLSRVRYYNGVEKFGGNVYVAVVDLPIGKRDLHQCADAIMRLRAEYLWKEKRYEQIAFNFTNGFRCEYSKWRKGNRVQVQGNRARWVSGGTPGDSYASFWRYLELVFSYAGTNSLAKELIAPQSKAIQIGDIFIQGGFPGHAVVVVDVARNPINGMQVFLLAQSYMPAQELQILANPMNPGLSPWYEDSREGTLWTPEWTFDWEDRKRFKDE